MDQTMKPLPASPPHSVPSQSKTATLGLQSRTSRSNSCVVHRGISICVRANRSSYRARKIRLNLLSFKSRDFAREGLMKRLNGQDDPGFLGNPAAAGGWLQPRLQEAVFFHELQGHQEVGLGP